MHPEELCRIIESNENNNSEEKEYEREMTSHEYLQKYDGTKNFSIRKYINLVKEERRQRNESKRLYYYGGK